MIIYAKEWENPNYKFLSYTVDSLNWHLHFHESFEICFVTDGETDITVEGVCYRLKKNDGLIIFPRQLHRYESRGESHMRIITFLPDLVPEFTKSYKNTVPENSKISGLETYSASFEPKNILAQKGLVYSVLGILTESTKFVPAALDTESRLLIKILQYIEKNYTGECALQAAAEELSYGYSYLSRTFKKLMQMSYTEYLNRYRINRAVYMLTSEKHMQIQEIAEKCGYDSLCSFNRNFKKFTGGTPSEVVKGENADE